MDAEFVVCIRGAKNTRYLRSILQQMGMIHVSPTIIYVDSIATIMNADAGKLTERSHHIDMQLFALLRRAKNSDVLLAHTHDINYLMFNK
jgi:hypothetical protein